jgi:hypothetical protein
MTGKNTDSDTQQWSDPKDYGLPYVAVRPLSESIDLEKTEKVDVPIDIKDVKRQTIQTIQLQSVEHSIPPKSVAKAEVNKSSTSWIWIAALLALGVVLVIIWQMNSAISSNDSNEIVATSTEQIAAEENDRVADNSTPTEEIQPIENQEIIDQRTTSSESIPQVPQTGTTIDNNVTDKLVRVTEKGERPIFYIIVGSLATEAMALSEAPKYYDRSQTIYLIMPYGDSKNYRLAINRSVGFTAMTEELERVKDQYNESLWILKY